MGGQRHSGTSTARTRGPHEPRRLRGNDWHSVRLYKARELGVVLLSPPQRRRGECAVQLFLLVRLCHRSASGSENNHASPERTHPHSRAIRGGCEPGGEGCTASVRYVRPIRGSYAEPIPLVSTKRLRCVVFNRS